MSSIPNLAHLPTEILLQIFKTETLTTRDRCSVALSARRLNHLATPLIYCQLYLGKKEPQKRLAILANIIEHQSHLAALVEEVSLAISKYQMFRAHYTTLMGGLSNLELLLSLARRTLLSLLRD